jgi:hypothetical protein
MADNQEANAIRTRLYIGGDYINRDPVPVQVSITRFEKKNRMSNGSMRVDRMFTAPGFPNIRNRQEIVLPWPDLREPDLLERLGILCNMGQPFTLGLWKRFYDVFDGDGVNTTFFLQRRQLLPVVTPDPTFPDYPTRVVRYSASYPGGTPTELAVVQKDTGDINTGTPAANEAWVEEQGHMNGALWCSTVRLGTPPPAGPDVLVAMYLPLYEVVVDVEAQRNYAPKLVEPKIVKFSEFG